MLIAGIDPGLAHTGWGIIDADHGKVLARAYGCVDTQTNQPLTDRLALIFKEIGEVFASYEPDVVAFEGVFFGTNARSALKLGEARSASILAAATRSIPCQEYSPAQVKQTIVGSGRAEKDQVAYMVKMQLGLDHIPHPDHCSDALAIALTHAILGRF